MANQDDDPTGGGFYLPSLPKMYQSIFDALGFPANPGPGPVHRELDLRNSMRRTMPARSMVAPRISSSTMRPDVGGGGADVPPNMSNITQRPDSGGNMENIPYYPPKVNRPPLYNPPPSDSPTSDFSDRPRPGALTMNRPVLGQGYTTSNFPERPVFVGRNLQGEPASSDTSDTSAPPSTSIYPSASTGRAHLSAPQVSPSQVSTLSTKDQSQLSKSTDTDTDEDTGPGSYAEAQRLFPGRQLQQATYYTAPPSGKSRTAGGTTRLGVGVDTSNLNPDYVSTTWEPADMSFGEKLIRGAFASGGSIDAADKISREKSTPCHVGPITMAVGGRTDHIPMNVLEGSYVLPADIVSGLGEGNTLAGSKLISNMFNSGPFGVSSKAPMASSGQQPSLGEYGSMQKLFNVGNVGQLQSPQKADGGPVSSGNYRPVPIVAAGGEYVIHPDIVRKLGNGSMQKGHDYLDNFVIGVRKHLVKTLSKLPGPRRD